MEYSFNIHIAQEFGVEEAIMIKNFQFWILKNKANKKHEHEGKTWTYNSVVSFERVFPFWSKSQIARILKSLLEKEVLIVGNFNKSKYDRTRWYSFSDIQMLDTEKWKTLKEKKENAKSQNGKAEIVQPIPNTNTNNKTTNPLFTQLIAEYHDWILEKVGAPPKINGAEGNAAKQILAYLSKITEDPIVAWKFILQHFDRIEPFLQKQIKLVQINSNLLNILNQIKNGKNTNQQSSQGLEAKIRARRQG